MSDRCSVAHRCAAQPEPLLTLSHPLNAQRVRARADLSHTRAVSRNLPLRHAMLFPRPRSPAPPPLIRSANEERTPNGLLFRRCSIGVTSRQRALEPLAVTVATSSAHTSERPLTQTTRARAVSVPSHSSDRPSVTSHSDCSTLLSASPVGLDIDSQATYASALPRRPHRRGGLVVLISRQPQLGRCGWNGTEGAICTSTAAPGP